MPKATSPSARRSATSRTANTNYFAAGNTFRRFAAQRKTLAVFAAAFGVLGTVFVWSSFAAAASGQVIGVAGRCSDVAYGKVSNGAASQIYDCNKPAGQTWSIGTDGTLRNQNYCLDVPGSAVKVKTSIQMYQCNNSAGQQWQLRADKSIINTNSGLCLTTQNNATTNGSRLWLWPCSSFVSQQWAPPANAPLQSATANVAVTSTTDTTSAPQSNPKAASSRPALYVTPNNKPATQATAWASSRPVQSAYMKRLGALPIAEWYGNWVADVKASVNTQVTNAANAGQVPLLVAYNIPGRDCGSYSAGGAKSDTEYNTWIQNFAAGIGQGRAAIVVLEPDAIPGMDNCMNQTQQTARMQLLANAVTTLRSKTNASVYLDAGNPGWKPADLMSSRLMQSNVANATGFALNVSNFYDTTTSLAYGNQISAQVGGKHFLIDTGRNGKGANNGEWCNPDGRALGTAPTLSTGVGSVDGFLYIKKVGDSDGTCGVAQDGTNAPSAGAWWPEYAVMLARNSGW